MEHEEKYKRKEFEGLELPDLKAEQQDNFTHVNCPSCNEQTSAGNIDLGSKMAKCHQCNAVFSVEETIKSVKVKQKQELPRPEGVEILHFRDELELSIAQPMLVIDILILCLLPAVALFAFALYFFKGEDPGIYVGIISLIISAFSLARYARRKENKIFLLLDNRKLTVKWRPRYFVKDKEFDVEDIEQVYVGNAPDGMALFITLNTVEGQKHKPIVKRMTNLGQAKYLEQEIEKYLNIPNRVVPGEF